MKTKLLLLFALALMTTYGCQPDPEDEDDSSLDKELESRLMSLSNGQGLSFFELPQEGLYSQLPQDPRNPITHEKVRLGKLLFHEPAIATKPRAAGSAQTFSCASCHFAQAGFQAGRFQGIGEGGSRFSMNRQKLANFIDADVDAQDIRSPSVLNSVYQEVTLWNGQFGSTGMNAGTESQWTAGTPKAVNHLGYQGLETQAIAGMDVHRLDIDPELIQELGYASLFDDAFPHVPHNDRYTKEMAGLAIAAYERTIVANRAPFQYWLRGQRSQMTPREKEGAILFFGKAGCGNCHTGPALNEMAFYGYGMKDLFECGEEVFHATPTSVGNLGRGGFTGKDEDMFQFKVPQLYNLVQSPFYGHGSSFRSVREVVAYKNEGIPENGNVPAARLAHDFQPLHLSENEVNAITDFIENALLDPSLDRYVPEAVLSEMCFPFNDPASRLELGCD